MTNKELALELIKYFELRNVTVTDGYEWREINGFILQLKHNFDVTNDEHTQISNQIVHTSSNKPVENETNIE